MSLSRVLSAQGSLPGPCLPKSNNCSAEKTETAPASASSCPATSSWCCPCTWQSTPSECAWILTRALSGELKQLRRGEDRCSTSQRQQLHSYQLICDVLVFGSHGLAAPLVHPKQGCRPYAQRVADVGIHPASRQQAHPCSAACFVSVHMTACMMAFAAGLCVSAHDGLHDGISPAGHSVIL